MAKLNIVPIETTGFWVRPALQGSHVTVAMSGTADMSVVPLLGVFLTDLHANVRHLASCTVVVDVRELYFLNSACLKQFVTWLTAIDAMGSNAYQVRFVTNPNLRWQRRTMEALRALGDGFVTIAA